MKITRDVILDLLPLYLAKEVSVDTRTLVEHYLDTDPELARAAERTAATNLPGDIPVPLTKEDEMEAYKEAKRLMLVRTIVIALAVAIPLTVSLVALLWMVGAGFLISG